MSRRFFTSAGRKARMLRIVCLAAAPALCLAPWHLAQAAENGSTAKSAKPYTPAKTPWGDPDLQGSWPASANIPMQRPKTVADEKNLTPEQLAQRQKQYKDQEQRDSEEFAGSGSKVTINPPGYWVEHGIPNQQTSLVVDPPDGRIPALTPEAEQRRPRPGRPLPGPGQLAGRLRLLQPVHFARAGVGYAADVVQLRQRNSAGARVCDHP
jgi:hypothetical protein